MGSLADGANAVWFMPQFWEVLPVTVFVFLFGCAISVAMVRARREDIPRILDILSTFFNAISTRREYRSPAQGRPRQDVVTGKVESVVVHPEKEARQGEGAPG